MQIMVGGRVNNQKDDGDHHTCALEGGGGAPDLKT
jgi:hypothetical protein